MTKQIFFIMGVSGTGKSTIGKMVASAFNIPFFDGDDFHPKANLEKMASGIPLNDRDREGWLKDLNVLAMKHHKKGAVIACSALKTTYRELLQKGIEKETAFIYLQGSFEQVYKRLSQRKGHFMPKDLLQSQFDTLEEPTEALTVSIAGTPNEILNTIKNQYL